VGLASFKPTRRRLELRAERGDIRLYDDFAHHPTAIRLTLDAVRARHGERRIIALLEPRSNTMRMGVHADTLGDSLAEADVALVLLEDSLDWDLANCESVQVFDSVDAIESWVHQNVQEHDQIVIMSNGAFGGVTQRLTDWLIAG